MQKALKGKPLNADEQMNSVLKREGKLMEKRWHRAKRAARRSQAGMTLIEVVFAFGISLFCVLGITYAYVYSANSAERFALSQAANNLALQRLEQTYCAQWVTSVSPGIDQLNATNFPAQPVTLDLSGSGTGSSMATNYTTIINLSTNPCLRTVHVDCVWLFGATQTLMTNSVEMIRCSQ